jgi:hypothetical protein
LPAIANTTPILLCQYSRFLLLFISCSENRFIQIPPHPPLLKGGSWGT